MFSSSACIKQSIRRAIHVQRLRPCLDSTPRFGTHSALSFFFSSSPHHRHSLMSVAQAACLIKQDRIHRALRNSCESDRFWLEQCNSQHAKKFKIWNESDVFNRVLFHKAGLAMRSKEQRLLQQQTEIDRLRHQIPHINAEVDAANQTIVQVRGTACGHGRYT